MVLSIKTRNGLESIMSRQDANALVDEVDKIDELSTAELEFLDGVTAGTAAGDKAVVLDSSRDIATIRNITSDGTMTFSGSALSEHISITGSATSAQIKVAGTAILASGEQAIYVNCAAETVATNGIWITLKSTVTSGDLSGVRSKVTSNSASGGANPRAFYGQAIVGASKFAGVVEGLLGVADLSAGTTDSDHICGVRGHVSSGAALTCNTTLYGVHGRVQTRGDETVSGTDECVCAENEAALGNGRQMNAYFKAISTNMGGGTKGAAYLLDGGTDTDLLATAVLRVPNDSVTGWDTATGVGDTEAGALKVVVGTSARYIQLWSDTP